MTETELIKRSPEERLIIANTLLDSVLRESDITLVNLALIKCMGSIENCLQILEKLKE